MSDHTTILARLAECRDGPLGGLRSLTVGGHLVAVAVATHWAGSVALYAVRDAPEFPPLDDTYSQTEAIRRIVLHRPVPFGVVDAGALAAWAEQPGFGWVGDTLLNRRVLHEMLGRLAPLPETVRMGVEIDKENRFEALYCDGPGWRLVVMGMLPGSDEVTARFEVVAEAKAR